MRAPGQRDRLSTRRPERHHHSRAPEPPPRFRGDFLRSATERARFAGSSGPVRLTPLAVARPVDIDDLATLVSWAPEEGIFLIPRGAGTGMPAGNVGAGVVVDLTSWTDIAVVDRATGLVRCGPGTTGKALDGSLRPAGFFLPSLPSSGDRCTVGGMVANNAAGARSFRYGATRAFVEALDVVLADGELVQLRRGSPPPEAFSHLHGHLRRRLGLKPGGWPRVRKNSSGYALDHFLPEGDPVSLLVGSEGTLGIVAAAEIRLAVDPAERVLALLPLPDLEALTVVVATADEVGAESCEFFAPSFLRVARLSEHPDVGNLIAGAEALALLELSGTVEEVEAGAVRIRSLASGLGVEVREARTGPERDRLWEVRHAASPIIASRAEEGIVSMQFIEDSVVPPERLVEYLRSLETILKGEETDAVMFGHAGDGNVHVNPLVDVGRADWRPCVRRILEATVSLVRDLGGTLSGEHGDGRIRAPFLDKVWAPELADAFREVKRTLDPEAVLNPGVIIPLPGQDPLAGLGPWRRDAR